MSKTPLPTPTPIIAPELTPYWEATAAGRLLLPHCRACGVHIWYPRTFCPDCGSVDVEWVEATGRGTIYTFSIVRRPQGAYKDVGSYVLAYVELEEGPRVLTNIVDADSEALEIGQAVEAVFYDTDSDAALLRFRISEPSVQREQEGM
jgi:uncharacterized OB-fold protein